MKIKNKHGKRGKHIARLRERGLLPRDREKRMRENMLEVRLRARIEHLLQNGGITATRPHERVDKGCRISGALNRAHEALVAFTLGGIAELSENQAEKVAS